MQGFKILIALCAIVSLAAAKDGKIKLPKPQEKNVCSKKEDGVFLPVAGSCSKYLVCVNGVAMEKDCGKYHFSKKNNICDLPERVGCTAQESLPLVAPSKPSEKEVILPTPTLPPCFAVANGIKLPVPGSQRQFYFCLNNKAFLKDCGNMYYSVEYSACAIKPDSFEPSILVTPPTVPLTQSSVCFGKPDGSLIPVAGSSRQFHFCINNKAFLKDCGSKMYFSTEFSACALRTDSSDSSFIVTPPKASSTQHESESSVCFGKPDGSLIPVAGNSRQFHFCINNKAFLKDCGSKMYFSTEFSACALRTDSSDSSFIVTPPTHHESESSVCFGKPNGALVPVAGNSRQFHFCINNKAFLKDCGSKMYFSTEFSACALASEQHESTGKLPAIHSTPKPSISSLADTICLNKKDGVFVSSPGQCSEFFFCLKNKGYRKSCGENRHFNPKSMICVDLKHSKCVDNSLMKKSERAILPRDESSCVNKESGTLLSSSTDCGKFLICDNGKPVEMDCPGGLYFNAQDNVCDWPTNVQCNI